MSGVEGKADLPVKRPDFSAGPKAAIWHGHAELIRKLSVAEARA